MEKKESEMKQDLLNWYNINDGHPNDNKLFFDIVIRYPKVGSVDFEVYLKGAGATDQTIDDIIKKYDWLHEFYEYLKEKGYIQK